MLLNRRTFTVKPGHEMELAALLKTGANHLDWIPPFRVMASRLGALNRVVLELDFETLADYEKFWNSWGSAPESAGVLATFHELTESGTMNEVWEVV